jgi:isocitrate dehydrogenase (NAD+)
VTKRYAITLIPGDGIGPEVTAQAVKVLEATGVVFEWDEQAAGMAAVGKFDTPIPDQTIESIRGRRLALKGPLTTPVGGGYRSVNVALRKEFELYANVRPTRSILPGGKFPDVDLVLVRENVEGLYVGVEHFVQVGADPRAVAESMAIVTRVGCERIVRYAFEYARANGRKKVTTVHKANIMKYSDGLYLKHSRIVAEEFSDIEFEDRIVDNMCMQLVQKPELYDVIVLPNLYGDILSDLAAGLVGGLGVAPGMNAGPEGAVFEATHGSAPKYKGQNKVNPTALILSGMLMLRHLQEREAADRLEAAVAAVIAEGKDVTYDMKPHRDDPTAVGTREMADAICGKLES